MNKILEEDIDSISNEIFKMRVFENSSFLITGATGLIGKIILMALLNANKRYDLNNKVFALVRNREKLRNVIGDYYSNDSLFVMVQNITQPIDLTENIDYIIHAAAPTSSKFMVTNPVETVNAIVEGTKQILDFARNCHVKKILYLSSLEVYGTHSGNEYIDEDYIGRVSSLQVRSSYPLAKQMAEQLCVSYQKEYGVTSVIARLTQTFGAGMALSDNRVFAQFVKSRLSGVSIELATKGESSKSYLYTVDAVSAIFMLLCKGENGKAYNVANKRTYISIINMANLVAKMPLDDLPPISVTCKIQDEKESSYAPVTQLNLSTEKLEGFGWTPKHDLDEMYNRLIIYIKQELEGV